MHEVLVNCLGGLSLPRKSVVRLTDHPCMTIDVYGGHYTTNIMKLNLKGSSRLQQTTVMNNIIFSLFFRENKT